MIARPGVEQDAEAVLALIRALPELPQWGKEALALGGVTHAGASGPVRRLLVADDRGAVAGFVQIATLLGEAEVESIAVLPGRQRQGTGRMLLHAAIERARQDGASLLRLEVRRSNEAALRLYERAGMSVTGVRPRYYSAPEEDALLLQLSWTEGSAGHREVSGIMDGSYGP